MTTAQALAARWQLKQIAALKASRNKDRKNEKAENQPTKDTQ
jgi:hypothetical protein